MYVGYKTKLHWCELPLHNFIEISVYLEIKICILITTLLLCHHWPTGTSLVAIHMRSDVYSRYGFEKLVTLRPHMRSTALAECRIQTEACDISLVSYSKRLPLRLSPESLA